jgi:hypothetical protein
MFLREGSKAHNVPVDLHAVRDARIDPLLPSGRELLAVADAVALWDHDEMPIARAALVDAVGEAGAVRAMGVAGNYAMMNRVLDGVGNPIRAKLEAMADELGVDYSRTDLRPEPGTRA